MKIILAVKGVREGVEVRMGVCRASDSWLTASVNDEDEDEKDVLVGMVILGLGFSTLAGCLGRDGPGAL